jgi:membrane protease YdiL (CAAX protease family)
MSVDGLIPALSVVFYAFFLVVGVYVYAALVRQVAARVPGAESPPPRTFGTPEAIIALLLAFFFLLTLAGAPTHEASRMRTRDLIFSAGLTIGLLLALAGYLRLRRFDVNSLGGFGRIGFFRTVVTGGILMLAAYPLILLGDIVTQRFLRGPPQKQAIVEMFSESSTLGQRIIIIVLAVSLAPVAEEFIFRFFMYGVAKRYVGRVVGVIASALLFAAVHGHLPSFAPLFVLGSCFAIAYEWSGSILVPMTMHALFNAITLTALAFPELIQQ